MNVAALEGMIRDHSVPDGDVLEKIIEFRQNVGQNGKVIELPLDLSNTTWQHRPALLMGALQRIGEREQKCCVLEHM